MADINREQIEQLVKRPGESLVVEIKTWISPAEPAGQAKIIKGMIALRNRGGGYLVIGFDDKTLQQDGDGVPADVRSAFHVDVIQGLATKYASDTFEISVEFVEYQGLVHPVIVVPPGVRTPVCAKAQLAGDGGKVLVERDAVYVRTLNSNNTPSTAKAQWKDWSDVVEICFDNREADIGRFLRRHLAGADPKALHEFATAISGNASAQESVRARLEKILADGFARFQTVVKERKVSLPKHGSWEVGLIMDGEFLAPGGMEEFANLLGSSNPSYTGWPVWLSSRQFPDKTKRPYVLDGAWETLIVALDPSSFTHIDFMRQAPSGHFYSYRALDDDIVPGSNAPTPMTTLEPILPIIRTAEAIAVALAFAKALKANEQTSLEFMFRWTGLRGRVLSSWAHPGRSIFPRTSQQDAMTSMVTVPLDTAPSSLGEYVKVALTPLYEVFEGFEVPGIVVDEQTEKLLERRL